MNYLPPVLWNQAKLLSPSEHRHQENGLVGCCFEASVLKLDFFSLHLRFYFLSSSPDQKSQSHFCNATGTTTLALSVRITSMRFFSCRPFINYLCFMILKLPTKMSARDQETATSQLANGKMESPRFSAQSYSRVWTFTTVWHRLKHFSLAFSCWKSLPVSCSFISSHLLHHKSFKE